MRFLCSQCNTRGITLHQWRDNTTVGICQCGYTTELTTEEVIMIIKKRVCDRLGCNAEIPEGTGKMIEIQLTSLQEDSSLEQEIHWELCDECADFFTDLMTSESRLTKLMTSRKISITRERAQKDIGSGE